MVKVVGFICSGQSKIQDINRIETSEFHNLLSLIRLKRHDNKNKQLNIFFLRAFTN